MKLTQQEIDFLLDAVDVFEAHKASAVASMKAALAMIPAGISAEDSDRIKAFVAAEGCESKQRLMRERCIVIKAKLLQCRDSDEADAFMDRAQQ